MGFGLIEVELVVPALLADCTGGRRAVPLQASSLAGVRVAIGAQYPLLRPHVFEEGGAMRPHVRLFLNGENVKWIADHATALRPGDRLEILQAVSGG